MLERISDAEKEAMLGYIDQYGAKCDGRRSAVFDYLFRIWDREKSKYLEKMFGDKLILSKEIVFEAGEDEMIRDLQDNILCRKSEFYEAYRAWVDKFEPTIDPEATEFWHRRTNLYGQLLDQISSKYLAENLYTGETFEVPLPNGKMYKVQNGSRPIRTLGRLAKEYDIPGFDDFRAKHSIVLTQKKLKGNLCLSIHPLDYMTMSDNESHWSSCMSWIEEGCYRQGTIEMMNSPMVVVAYLTASEPFNLSPYGVEEFNWNNKKWRELFVVNADIITNVKPYPYRNEQLTRAALTWIKELAEAAGIGEYTDNIYEYSTRYCDNENNKIEELGIESCNITPTTQHMYNDFSKLQWAYFSKHLAVTDKAVSLRFNYSGPSECMACGAENPELCNEGFLFCVNCGDTEGHQCDSCGEYYPEEDMWFVDGDYLCEDCVNNYCTFDPIDEEYHYSENMSNFYITFDGGETYYDADFALYMYGCTGGRNSYMTRYFGYIDKAQLYNRSMNFVYLIDGHLVTDRGWNVISDMNECRSWEDYERYYSESVFDRDHFQNITNLVSQ